MLAWTEAIEHAIAGLGPGLRALAEAGCPAPDEIGYEHANDAGAVDAEAELAWSASRVVLLAGAQVEYLAGWSALGWQAIAAEGDWVQSVRSALAKVTR